jgi:hypothetical protein
LSEKFPHDIRENELIKNIDICCTKRLAVAKIFPSFFDIEPFVLLNNAFLTIPESIQ